MCLADLPVNKLASLLAFLDEVHELHFGIVEMYLLLIIALAGVHVVASQVLVGKKYLLSFKHFMAVLCEFSRNY